MKNKEGDYQYDWEQGQHAIVNAYGEFMDKLKDSMKQNADELNTPEEKRFLKYLYDWIDDGGGEFSRLPAGMYKDLKYLLKIKKKFPLVLDPMQSSNNLNKFWRGGSLPLDKAKEILDNAKQLTDKIPPGQARAKYGILNHYQIKTSVKSRALENKKYASFTSSWSTAISFHSTQIQNTTDDRVPVILEIPANLPKLLFNPEFLNLFSDYSEHETFYVDNKEINITGIHLNPYAVEAKLKNLKQK